VPVWRAWYFWGTLQPDGIGVDSAGAKPRAPPSQWRSPPAPYARCAKPRSRPTEAAMTPAAGDWPDGRSASEAPDGLVIRYRLHCTAFWVDVRLLEINGRWIASADTPDGPSLGCGLTDFEALWQVLEPFAGAVGELMASLPPEDQ
jgi:hypothetical protein